MNIQKSLQDRIREIVDYINNPQEDASERIIENIIFLCGGKVPTKLGYTSSGYCAFSGVELKDDAIQIDGYSFSPNHVQQYYLRQGILDISIGDLQFNYYDASQKQAKGVKIEQSFPMLKTIFGENLENLLEEAARHFSKRFDQPAEFQCEETGIQDVSSEQFLVNGKKVSQNWASQNIDQLNDDQKRRIQLSKEREQLEQFGYESQDF